MAFIEQKNARIFWKCFERTSIVEDVRVESIDFNEGDQESPHYKLWMTAGNCYSNWNSLYEAEIMQEIFRIMIDYEFSKDMKKKFILELGKIKPLIHVRGLARYYIENDLIQEEFDEKYY